MSLSSKTKQFSIATGLYRPARWLSQRVRPDQGRRFRDDVALYRSLLPHGGGALCFDVGANIGGKSQALALAGAKIVAFEPSCQVLPELRARCGHLQNWTLIQAAVGSEAGIATLFARQNHAQSSLAENREGTPAASHSVPVVTLDAAIKHFGRPYFCKIDVEGWELEVLRGLSEPIPLISFEFHLRDAEIARARACLQRLLELGGTAANVTPAESSRFLFQEWMPLGRFLEWFPGNLAQTLPRDQYGDIFVRSEAR